MKRRRRSCIGCAVPFFGVVVIYLFVRMVPAGWYMLRGSRIILKGPVSAGSSLGVGFSHYIRYYDYSPGIWDVMNNGPRERDVSESSVVARIGVGGDQSLSLSGVEVGRAYDLWQVMAWDGAIAYVATGGDNAARLALFDGASVRFMDGVIDRSLIPTIFQMENDDIILAHRVSMRVGRRLTEDERAFFDRERPTFDSCRIPQTCTYVNYGAEGATNVTLYTFLPAGGLATNTYPCPLAAVGIVTAMGTPEDALFASFDRIPGRGRPSTRVDQIIYTVWNRRGVVRKIEMPAGVEPAAEVDLFEAAGRRYLTYCHAKKVRRHKVTLSVAFVDLDSGCQIERDLTIPIPPGVGRVVE